MLLFIALAIAGQKAVDREYDDRGVMDTKVAFLDIFEEVQGLASGRLLGHIWSARRAHLGSNRSPIAVESAPIF